MAKEPLTITSASYSDSFDYLVEKDTKHIDLRVGSSPFVMNIFNIDPVKGSHTVASMSAAGLTKADWPGLFVMRRNLRAGITQIDGFDMTYAYTVAAALCDARESLMKEKEEAAQPSGRPHSFGTNFVVADVAQWPEVGSRWRHRNGTIYVVDKITNKPNREDYPTTVVYHNEATGHDYSRFLSRWYRSMTLLP